MKRSLLLVLPFLCMAGCNLKTDGNISVNDPIRVKVDDISVDDISLKKDKSNSSIKTINNYFCQAILESTDSLCASIIADEENVHYLISLDSGRTHGIRNLSLAVDGVPIINLCDKCSFKKTTEPQALVLFGSAKANERIANSINTIIYSIQSNGVEKFLYSNELKNKSRKELADKYKAIKEKQPGGSAEMYLWQRENEKEYKQAQKAYKEFYGNKE